jgi:hypothetical protein
MTGAQVLDRDSPDVWITDSGQRQQLVYLLVRGAEPRPWNVPSRASGHVGVAPHATTLTGKFSAPSPALPPALRPWAGTTWPRVQIVLSTPIPPIGRRESGGTPSEQHPARAAKSTVPGVSRGRCERGRPNAELPHGPPYRLCRARSPCCNLNSGCRGAESNRRHCDFQSHALPTELPRLRVPQPRRCGGRNRTRTCDLLGVSEAL